MRDKLYEDICYKLRETEKEFGRGILDTASIIGPWGYESVGGLSYIETPTLGKETLSGVPYKVARFFEDVYKEELTE